VKKIIVAIIAAAMMLSLLAVPVMAAEVVNVASYTEVFTPVNEADGQLAVTVKGTAGEDGYMYIIAAAKGMEPVSVAGENLSGTELEAYKNGSESYFRIAVADPAAEATVEATFNVPGFYAVSRAAETNGAEDYKMSYKFTNYFPTKIGSYDVMVYVPEGMEISKVSSPSAYADYNLAELNGLRGAGNTKALAAAAANTLTFTFDKAAGGMTNILIWVVCLAIGAFVFVDRYKKAMKE